MRQHAHSIFPLMPNERMAAKLRPRMILLRPDSSTAARTAKARGRQLQPLVSRRLHVGYEGSVICHETPDRSLIQGLRWRTSGVCAGQRISGAGRYVLRARGVKIGSRNGCPSDTGWSSARAAG